MTRVAIHLMIGTGQPAVGQVRWRATSRVDLDEGILLPKSMSVELYDGKAELDVPPSPGGEDPVWAWEVVEDTIEGVTRLVQVPDSESVLSYRDGLIDLLPEAITPPPGHAYLTTEAGDERYVRTVNEVGPDESGDVVVEGGSGTMDHGALSGLSDDDHPQYFDETRGDARYALSAHTHTADKITDSTTTGRSVLTAANSGAARSAIGAGTSSLTLGTGAGTAAEADKVVLLAGAQSIAGVKTFTSIPSLPASDPTNNNQAVRKAYVDTGLSGKAADSHTHPTLPTFIEVWYLSTGWPARPTTTGTQYVVFGSWRAVDAATESNLIAAPEPPWVSGDAWDPHPESAFYDTLD